MLQSVVGFLADIVDGARTAFSSLQALDESSYKSEGQKSFRSEKVQNAINDINELVKGGMSREDALNWEENLTRDLYKRADSLEEKKKPMKRLWQYTMREVDSGTNGLTSNQRKCIC